MASSVWSQTWRSTLCWTKLERSLSLPSLWHHGHYKDQTEGAYFTTPYRGETLSSMFCGIMVRRKSHLKKHTVLSQTAFHCQFCGVMAITKTKLKEHTSLLNTGDKSFSASFVASWSVWSQTWRSSLRWAKLQRSLSLLVLWHHGQTEWACLTAPYRRKAIFLQDLWKYSHSSQNNLRNKTYLKKRYNTCIYWFW